MNDESASAAWKQAPPTNTLFMYRMHMKYLNLHSYTSNLHEASQILCRRCDSEPVKKEKSAGYQDPRKWNMRKINFSEVEFEMLLSELITNKDN